MDFNSEEKKTRIYEIGYLLFPTLSEEEMPALYARLKDLVVDFGAEIISDEMPKMMPLAYTISKVIQNIRSKFDSAYFGWIKFEVDPEKMGELKKKLNLEQNILRSLIIKTVKENTIASKRFVNRDLRRKISIRKEGEENENAIPIDKEEIDKEIDAMVA